MANSPVQPVTFGQAMSISLNNYYDLLKGQVGSLKTDEFIQLKLVADPVDVSETKYPWYSYYNFLQRSDQGISPTPLAGIVGTSASQLWEVYERFLRKLRTFVVEANLSTDDQKAVAALDTDMDGLRTEITKWQVLDRTNWKTYAEQMGYSPGDNNAYLQWLAVNGHSNQIQRDMQQLSSLMFQQRTLLNKQFPEPTDREVVDAESDFYAAAMRLRYPIFPDFQYDNGDRFSLTYLASLPLGDTALFADRRVIALDKSLDFIQQSGAGSFSAAFDRNTSDSTSISTDWNASASGSYFFISVNASATEHTQIQSDFSKATSLEVSAGSAFRVNLNYPNWFRPTLFSHKRVLENAHEFLEFLSPQGSLLYYPTGLILVRGFKVIFKSTQNWSFDYAHKFSASGGGGFNVFGIGFGSSGSYTNETKEHQVDQTSTTLTISDDSNTVRFVGYAVKKNAVVQDHLGSSTKAVLGPSVTPMLLKAPIHTAKQR